MDDESDIDLGHEKLDLFIEQGSHLKPGWKTKRLILYFEPRNQRHEGSLVLLR